MACAPVTTKRSTSTAGPPAGAGAVSGAGCGRLIASSWDRDCTRDSLSISRIKVPALGGVTTWASRLVETKPETENKDMQAASFLRVIPVFLNLAANCCDSFMGFDPEGLLALVLQNFSAAVE